jgi:hypothetical protein
MYSNTQATAKTVKDILQDFNMLQTERAKMESLYADIDRFVMDRQANMTSGITGTEGSTSHEVYNKSGVAHNTRLAATLQGFIAPAEQRWFSLEVSKSDPNVTSFQTRSYLDYVENTVYDILAATNFYQKSLETMTDFTAYGFGVLYVEHDPLKKIKFISIPIRECYIATDFNGEVNKVTRHFQVSSSALLARFRKELEAKAPHHIADLEKNPQNQQEVLHCVYPNPKYNSNSTDSQARQYISHYVLKSKDVLLETKYYRRMPYLTPRWTVTSGEVYGRSQAMNAIPDLKALSVLTKNTLTGISKLADPSILVASGSIAGRGLNLKPNGITVLDHLQGNSMDNTIKTFNSNARPDISMQGVEMFEQKIARLFFADLIAEDKQQRMSASESNTRHALRITSLSPQVARAIPEYLSPLINLVVGILVDNNYIEPPPEDISNISIDFHSPMAKAQKMQSSEGILNFTQILGSLAQYDPSVLNTVDFEQVAQFLAMSNDIPTSVLRSPEQLAEMKKEQQAQAAQQQAAQQAETASKAVKNTAQAADALYQEPPQ